MGKYWNMGYEHGKEGSHAQPYGDHAQYMLGYEAGVADREYN